MKKTFSILITLVLVLATTVPAFAQLGTTDISQFTVQNISGGSVQVTVQFVAENGTFYTPVHLGSGGTPISNPFTLADGEAKQIYVPNIPVGELPSGRYSVVISATGKVVAMAGVAGNSTVHFVGNYSSAASGATSTYLANLNFNYNGWYGMISVQNLGSGPADVTVTIRCSDGVTVGTLTQLDIPVMAAKTFVLKPGLGESVIPTGFVAGTVCQGSAVITSDQPIVAVSNQNKPSTGSTTSFEAAAIGYTKLYVPHLQNAYYGWNSTLHIRKLAAGATTVTIDYSDAASPNSTCNLTDAIPACHLYIPTAHPIAGRVGAIITSTGSIPVAAVVVGEKSGSAYAGAYSGSGASAATATVSIPLAQNNYYNWGSSITCQNLSTTATTLKFTFTGYPPYNDANTLNEGDSVQITLSNMAFLPVGWYGGVTVTPNTVGAKIACMVGSGNVAPAIGGDWNNQYNAYNR